MKLVSIKILALILTLNGVTRSASAQTMFSTYPDINTVPLSQCLGDHERILDAYADQLDSQIKRILSGIHQENQKRKDPETLKAYRQVAIEAIMKRIVIEELATQTAAWKVDPRVTKNPKSVYYANHLLNTDQIEVEIKKQFDAVVLAAGQKAGLGKTLLKVYLDELKHEAITHFAKNLVKEIGNGLILKILSGAALEALTGSAIKTAVLNFSAAVIAEATFKSFIFILTAPLKGGRKPPETLWLDVLKKYPELVINPEWMSDAGVPDSPWTTHCMTIARKPKQLESSVRKMIQKEETIFYGRALSAYQKGLEREKEAKGLSSGLNPTPASSLYVAPQPALNPILTAPNWLLFD